MPRNPGTGVYTKPSPDVITGTTIESTVYNTFVGDVETDLNLPRPVSSGGTGANNATAARDNLDAEVSGAQVTNYDTHVFENGTVWSAAGATGAPNSTSGFAGICYIYSTPASGAMAVHVRDLNDSVQPGRLWSRQKLAGAWSGPWSMDSYVIKTGDTMTGNLSIEKPSPVLGLAQTDNTGACVISSGNITGAYRGVWAINLGNGVGSGNHFQIAQFSDAGAFLGFPLEINRATGKTTLRSLGASAVLEIIDGVLALPVTSPGVINMAYGFYGIVFRPPTDVVYPNIFKNAADVTVGYITTSATATGYATTSDARLKEDLKSFDAGNIVDNTNVYDFKWKSTDERAYGMIAQQAVEVYPTAVSHDEKADVWGIDYSKYVPVIMQELESLRARVAELEARLEGKPT